MKNNKLLTKGAYWTDVHFGKKANSQLHNEDCIRFVEWFCEQVRKDPEIDYIAFLGDWNENRSSLNIATLNMSYKAAKMLNGLGMPVYFVVGNHDLYYRNSREIHSVIPFAEFENFVIIEEPTVIEEIHGKVLFVPFLFPEEYPSLSQYQDIPFWAGHFEFQGFEVTGYGMKMPTGPNHKDFTGPKYIASGHFHKRQIFENVVYIGNAFPMDFGDAGDVNRGMMTYDNVKQEMLFENWNDCPKYVNAKLSELLDGTVTLYPDSRVKCVCDIQINFEENQVIKEQFTKKYNLREFVLEESVHIQEALEGAGADLDWADDGKNASTDELVNVMLMGIESDHIDNTVLSSIYTNLGEFKCLK